MTRRSDKQDAAFAGVIVSAPVTEVWAVAEFGVQKMAVNTAFHTL